MAKEIFRCHVCNRLSTYHSEIDDLDTNDTTYTGGYHRMYNFDEVWCSECYGSVYETNAEFFDELDEEDDFDVLDDSEDF